MNKYILVIFISLISISKSFSQENELTKKEIKETIQLISETLINTYVDLEKANKMSFDINKNSNKYKEIKDPKVFSKVLTKDLQRVSKDLHLKVNFEPKRIAQKKRVMPKEMLLKREKMMAMRMAEINYGFNEVKILTGNIGYLNLRMFADLKYAKETAAATMQFLEHTQAIIIDLRNNGGGVPNMVQFLASYFTEAKPVILSNFYERRTGEKTQLLTFKNIKGKINRPLYILTSKKTFSAAEAFAYSLKHLKKAIIVGEQTKGGANRTKRINLNNKFSISVPYIKATHPVTMSNWEGIGVLPTLKTSKRDAFLKAYLEAVTTTVRRNKKNILNKIGYSYLQEKKINNALIVFKKATKLYPKEANTWDSLAEAYLFKNDKENALKAYQKALLISPKSKALQEKVNQLIK